MRGVFRVSLASVVGAFAALGGASAAQEPDLADQYANLAQLQKLSSKCKWLEPLEAVAVEATRDELASRMATQGVRQSKQVDAMLETAARVSCTEQAVQLMAPQSKAIASRLGANWLLRAEAVVNLTEPWAVNLTTATAHSAVIRAGADLVVAGDPAAGAAVRAQARTSAVQALALVCPERRAIRVSGAPRACPSTASADLKFASEAAAWVRGVERFATAYAAASAGLAPPRS